MDIHQELIYHNTARDTLQEIYLHDWNNAFQGKTTPLAKRFSEDYIRKFHFAREEERGATTIKNLYANTLAPLEWERPAAAPDLIKVTLQQPLPPGERYTLNIEYRIKVPGDKFTRYGYAANGNYQLRYWFLTPGVYKNDWQVYSHKNLNDLFIPKFDIDISIKIPSYLAAISALHLENIESENKFNTFYLSGREWLDTRLYLTRNFAFEDIETDSLNILTNISDEGLNPPMKHAIANRIAGFLNRRLGSYPQQFMLITQEDYLANQVYGLNQLPKFIRPFPDGFQYDLKLLKAITGNYLENSLQLNPRKEKWVFDAIQIYLMMEYMDENYPNIKILGNLSDFFGIRWLHASELEFNDQYSFLYLHMVRRDLDQALTTPQDSLVKFNQTIANANKAGVGMKYLKDFTEDNTVSRSIQEFFTTYKLKKVSAGDFEKILKENAPKDIDWFFKNYVASDENIDFKINKIEKKGDSLQVTIKNKTRNNIPVSVYAYRGKKIISKTWVEDIKKHKTISLPAAGVERIALNAEGVIPEINRRDNYREVGSILNKPVQFRLFKDVEDPSYTQIFFFPEAQYNLYDGISFGPRIYNRTVLKKNFEYQFSPLYGLNSETLVGGASFSHRIPFQDQGLYYIRYGAGGSRFSYGRNLFYKKFTPFLSIAFREPDLRSNKKEFLTIRNVNVMRDQDHLRPDRTPDYSVFNVKYRYSDPGMVDYLTGDIDFQLSDQFSKFSLTAEYRKLFKNNTQINLRFFGGTFLYNDSGDSDYFSFALDRPSDYLFDYNYYGRSETSGLFSQQIIMAEGGFKSNLQPEFANQWLTSFNASTNIWNWIYVYGDVGLVKNKGTTPKFMFDSGIRLSFVADYFEVFFPVYSNLGWEITQENYDQKIRFIATLDLDTLLGMFSREWY